MLKAFLLLSAAAAAANGLGAAAASLPDAPPNSPTPAAAWDAAIEAQWTPMTIG
jgi:hypothetical protein